MNQSTIKTTASPSSTPAVSVPISPAASAGNVIISNFAFSPDSIIIKKGESVSWTNKDSAAHAIVSDTGSEISSSTLSHDQSYTHTFTSAGTYAYHCSIHPGMKGTVIVQ